MAAAPLAGQHLTPGDARTSAQTGVVWESYSLGAGLAFDRISQLVIPVSVMQRVGRAVVIDVSSAYASASVRTIGGDIDVSGLIDTDVRAVVSLVPSRVLLTLVGTLPTGQATVPDTTLPLYGATATDLFGFAAPSFGGGGGVTAGLATALPLGRAWAAGVGASYRYGAAYTPVEGGGDLKPGPEGRLRIGAEGPLAASAYFRGALVYSTSGRDEIEGGPGSAIGDRVLVYASFNLPVGRGALSLYGWDMRRFGAGGSGPLVPAGNLLALGARLERPVSPTVTLVPGVEFRHELSGADSLALLGWMVRPGVDARVRVKTRATLVAAARYAFGRVSDEGTTVSLHGPWLSLVLEWTP